MSAQTPPTPWTMHRRGGGRTLYFTDAEGMYAGSFTPPLGRSLAEGRATAELILSSVSGEGKLRELRELILRLDPDEGLSSAALAGLQGMLRQTKGEA